MFLACVTCTQAISLYFLFLQLYNHIVHSHFQLKNVIETQNYASFVGVDHCAFILPPLFQKLCFQRFGISAVLLLIYCLSDLTSFTNTYLCDS
jgi:hypothetical protein